MSYSNHLVYFVKSLFSPQIINSAILSDNIKEIYVHTTEERGRENFFVEGYEPPIENFIDCDTTIDNEFQSYRKLLQKLDL